MISIKECKATLEQSGRKYTNEEVEKIRDMLYKLAQLDIELFKERQKRTNAEIPTHDANSE